MILNLDLLGLFHFACVYGHDFSEYYFSLPYSQLLIILIFILVCIFPSGVWSTVSFFISSQVHFVIGEENELSKQGRPQPGAKGTV